MSLLRKFYALEPADRRLLLLIITVLPLTALGLRLSGFERTFARLSVLVGRSYQAPLEDEAIYVDRVQRWIRYTKRHGPYPGTCLSRSLVLWCLLRRQGIESILRIGTRTQDEQFQAHAWVEYHGRPVNAGQRVRQHYATFDYAFTPESLQGVAKN